MSRHLEVPSIKTYDQITLRGSVLCFPKLVCSASSCCWAHALSYQIFQECAWFTVGCNQHLATILFAKNLKDHAQQAWCCKNLQTLCIMPLAPENLVLVLPNSDRILFGSMSSYPLMPAIGAVGIGVRQSVHTHLKIHLQCLACPVAFTCLSIHAVAECNSRLHEPPQACAEAPGGPIAQPKLCLGKENTFAVRRQQLLAGEPDHVCVHSQPQTAAQQCRCDFTGFARAMTCLQHGRAA